MTMRKENIFEAKEWFAVLHSCDRTQAAVMTLAPGTASGEKANEHPKSEQVLLVLKGEVVAEIGGARTPLGAGDCVVVPAGIPHRFVNAGDKPAVTFNVYSPPAY